MTTIYRITDDTNHGPFGSHGIAAMETGPEGIRTLPFRQQIDWIRTHQMSAGRDGMTDCWAPHPSLHGGETPVGDAAKWGREGVFGFISPEQLCHYFPKDQREKLAAIGFHVAVYECPESAIHFGGHQVFFHLTEAKLLRTEPLSGYDHDIPEPALAK